MSKEKENSLDREDSSYEKTVFASTVGDGLSSSLIETQSPGKTVIVRDDGSNAEHLSSSVIKYGSASKYQENAEVTRYGSTVQ